MNFLRWLKKRLGKISLRHALIFTLVNAVFLLYFSNIVVRLLFFTACALVIFYLGRLPVDVDLSPLASAILMHWYSPAVGIQFAIWTLPAADVLAGQFNQWTFVSVISLICGLLIGSFFIGFNYKVLFMASIIAYNLVRMFITSIIMKNGVSGIQAGLSHMFIYLVLIGMIPF